MAFLSTLEHGGKPQLSPDGKEIAFASIANGMTNLWIMEVNTKRLRQLTFDGATGFPVWSPDGRLLAAQRGQGSDTHLVVVNPANGAVQDLLADHAQNWVNAWSPDGGRIYYAKLETTGVWNIWAIFPQHWRPDEIDTLHRFGQLRALSGGISPRGPVGLRILGIGREHLGPRI